MNKQVMILTLMLRKKDNPEIKRDKYIFREVYTLGDFEMREEKIEKLEAISKIHEGNWRIYESINPRDTDKAKKMLMHRIIDGFVNLEKIDSEWKSILQKTECRGGRKFLLDLDDCTVEDKNNVVEYLNEKGVEILEQNLSVTGYHIITDKFDCREIAKKFSFVDVKRDDMKLIESFTI